MRAYRNHHVTVPATLVSQSVAGWEWTAPDAPEHCIGNR